MSHRERRDDPPAQQVELVVQRRAQEGERRLVIERDEGAEHVRGVLDVAGDDLQLPWVRRGSRHDVRGLDGGERAHHRETDVGVSVLDVIAEHLDRCRSADVARHPHEQLLHPPIEPVGRQAVVDHAHRRLPGSDERLDGGLGRRPIGEVADHRREQGDVVGPPQRRQRRAHHVVISIGEEQAERSAIDPSLRVALVQHQGREDPVVRRSPPPPGGRCRPPPSPRRRASPRRVRAKATATRTSWDGSSDRARIAGTSDGSPAAPSTRTHAARTLRGGVIETRPGGLGREVRSQVAQAREGIGADVDAVVDGELLEPARGAPGAERR